MKRILDMLTLCDIAAALLLIILTPMYVQAEYKRIYLGPQVYGSFSSPNYPSPYPRGIYYEWVMPLTSKELQIEFIELDLYKCYVIRRNRDCDVYDYVHVSKGDKYYCNWNKPTKPVTFLPWTQGVVAFYSSDSSANCKGRGFKVKYRPVDSWREPTTTMTTTQVPRIMPTMSRIPTIRFKSTDGKSSGQRSKNFSATSLLLILLVIPLILILACLYWCCRRSRRPTVNQDQLQTSINNWNYQTTTPVGLNNRGHTVGPITHQDGAFLTVNLPPMPRSGYSDNIAQITQPTSPRAQPVQRQGNNNERPETAAPDPPPSYDDVWESNDLNPVGSMSFESPPSYEAVMRESRENLNQEPVDPEPGNAERCHNDVRENVRRLALESNTTSNEANLRPRILEIII